MQKSTGSRVGYITRTVSLKTYGMLEAWIPEVMVDDQLRSLLFGLLNGGARYGQQDEHNSRWVLSSAEWVAYQVNRHNEYMQHEFSALSYLKRLQEALPSDWDFSWSDYNYVSSSARSVILQPPTYITEILDNDRLKQDTPRVYLRSGKLCSGKARTDTYAELATIEKEALTYARHEIQADILHYLHQRSLREFSPSKKKDAYEYAQTLPPLVAKQTKDKLATIFDYTKPIYHPVSGCFRLYSPGLQFLQSSVREILFPTMIDFDLKSCHAAILSKVLNLEKIGSLLASGQSIWNYLINAMDITCSAELYPDVKWTIKQAVYSICFGAGPRSVGTNFKQNLQSFGFSKNNSTLYWRRFRAVDIVAELLEGTLSWRKSMVKRDTVGPLGEVYHPKNLKEAQSACFSYCSAYELLLIYPVYLYAKQHPQELTILLHSHDGVMVKFSPRGKHKPEKVFQRVAQAVQDQAESLGIPTTLECKSPLV